VPTAQTPAVATPSATSTPLNSGAVADSASRLGLTVRETPATVEVIDQQTIKERGFRTVSEVAQGAVGVTAGDAPGAASAFSMRGYSFSEINTLYNGIKIGPQSMTSRVMDTGNLEQVEILKGPASLMSGEGATGGAINFVTKRPHQGPITNEAFTSYDSFNGYRAGFGSGGSTTVKGLDYRFDLTRSSSNSFVEDTYTKLLNISTQLDYRVTDSFKVWGALEYKQDRGRTYWGTPLVSAASSGPFGLSGVVSGVYTTQNGSNLGPVTIDSRTYKTSYNVLDNHVNADELWLRGGFEWAVNNDVTVKSQFYGYGADREWLDSETYQFNASTGLVERDRFFVAHRQRLVGNVTDLTWNSNIAGMDNRFAAALAASALDFFSPQSANFPSDEVTLVNPMRGFYGDLVTRTSSAKIDNVALSFEDRLKLTRTFSLIGGVRVEEIALDRTATNADGTIRDGFPFSKTWTPVTGRVGYTWDAVPGLTFYSQYATAADVAAANIFILGPLQPRDLTTSRIYETGVKNLLWNGRAEWWFSAFDIERKNVFTTRGGHLTNVAGKVHSDGVEFASAIYPAKEWKLWANVAYVDAKYIDFVDSVTGQSFAGNTPPNVPRVVANAGASYRFATRWPLELGVSVRHVGNRYVSDDNSVTMLAYTIAEAFAFVDIENPFTGVDKTRVTFRVRNLTDRKYAAWSDPGYPDQVLLGAPRSYEVSFAAKF